MEFLEIKRSIHAADNVEGGWRSAINKIHQLFAGKGKKAESGEREKSWKKAVEAKDPEDLERASGRR